MKATITGVNGLGTYATTETGELIFIQARGYRIDSQVTVVIMDEKVGQRRLAVALPNILEVDAEVALITNIECDAATTALAVQSAPSDSMVHLQPDFAVNTIHTGKVLCVNEQNFFFVEVELGGLPSAVGRIYFMNLAGADTPAKMKSRHSVRAGDTISVTVLEPDAKIVHASDTGTVFVNLAQTPPATINLTPELPPAVQLEVGMVVPATLTMFGFAQGEPRSDTKLGARAPFGVFGLVNGQAALIHESDFGPDWPGFCKWVEEGFASGEAVVKNVEITKISTGAVKGKGQPETRQHIVVSRWRVLAREDAERLAAHAGETVSGRVIEVRNDGVRLEAVIGGQTTVGWVHGSDLGSTNPRSYGVGGSINVKVKANPQGRDFFSKVGVEKTVRRR